MRGIKSVALLCTLALGAPAFSAGLTKNAAGRFDDGSGAGGGAGFDEKGA